MLGAVASRVRAEKNRFGGGTAPAPVGDGAWLSAESPAESSALASSRPSRRRLPLMANALTSILMRDPEMPLPHEKSDVSELLELGDDPHEEPPLDEPREDDSRDDDRDDARECEVRCLSSGRSSASRAPVESSMPGRPSWAPGDREPQCPNRSA